MSYATMLPIAQRCRAALLPSDVDLREQRGAAVVVPPFAHGAVLPSLIPTVGHGVMQPSSNPTIGRGAELLPSLRTARRRRRRCHALLSRAGAVDSVPRVRCAAGSGGGVVERNSLVVMVVPAADPPQLRRVRGRGLAVFTGREAGAAAPLLVCAAVYLAPPHPRRTRARAWTRSALTLITRIGGLLAPAVERVARRRARAATRRRIKARSSSSYARRDLCRHWGGAGCSNRGLHQLL